MILINNKIIFFLMKLYFLKYKNQQIIFDFIKIIVNLLMYQANVLIHFNLRA